jgi:hypothetical protein
MPKKNILRHCLLELMVAAASSDKPKEVVSKILNLLDMEGGLI